MEIEGFFLFLLFIIAWNHTLQFSSEGLTFVFEADDSLCPQTLDSSDMNKNFL